MKTSDNLPDVVDKYEEEQAMVSLKKKGQLLGFWSSLPYKENISQGQGQAEMGLIEGNSTADGTESCTAIIEKLSTSTDNGSASSAINPSSSAVDKPVKRARAQEELQEKFFNPAK